MNSDQALRSEIATYDCYDFFGMVEVHRVVASFTAEQLQRVRPRSETFEVGELLLVLTSDGTHTVFCLYEEAKELSNRSRFSVADEVFKRCTKASEPGSSPSNGD